jgi:hypothetical protein
MNYDQMLAGIGAGRQMPMQAQGQPNWGQRGMFPGGPQQAQIRPQLPPQAQGGGWMQRGLQAQSGGPMGGGAPMQAAPRQGGFGPPPQVYGMGAGPQQAAMRPQMPPQAYGAMSQGQGMGAPGGGPPPWAMMQQGLRGGLGQGMPGGSQQAMARPQMPPQAYGQGGQGFPMQAAQQAQARQQMPPQMAGRSVR